MTRLAVNWTPELAAEWVDSILDKKAGRFLTSGRAQVVSFREICSPWEWARRSDVYTHYLHSYPAKLLPYIPIAFLSSSLLPPNAVVLDCFAGTGTVLLESIVHQFLPRSAMGAEINPLARLIASVKTTPLSVARLSELSRVISERMNGKVEPVLPEFENRNFWFRESAQKGLGSIRAVLENLECTSAEKDFFRVCLSSIIRDMSRADPKIAPPVVMRADNFEGRMESEVRKAIRKKQRFNAVSLFKKRVALNIRRMDEFVNAVGPHPETRAEIVWDDAKSVRRGWYIEAGKISKNNSESLSSKIGMILTSPPYIAAQKYVRTTKLEIAWLGLADDAEIRRLDMSTIGSERIRLGKTKELMLVGNRRADILLKRVFKVNPHRSAIASKYFRDMRETLDRMHRLLKPGGFAVLVVGNNEINGELIRNDLILSEIANEKGMFATKVVLRDAIRSRGMMTKRHDTAGVISDEYVIVLQKGKSECSK